MGKKSVKKHYSNFTHRTLMFRLYVYYFITIAMLGLVAFDILTGQVNVVLDLIAIVCGFGIGMLTSRTSHITFDKRLKKIISRMDFFGIIVVIVYTVFSLIRENIITFFVHGPAVGAVSFALITGVMGGRVFGIRQTIVNVLAQERIQ